MSAPKKIRIYFIFILLILCGKSEQLFAQDQERSCPIEKSFDGVTLCLPELSNMVECSDDELVSLTVKNRNHDNLINLAIYLRESDLKLIKKENSPLVDGSLAFFTAEFFKGKTITSEDILNLEHFYASGEAGDHITQVWEEVQNMINKKDPDFKSDVPVKIDQYFLADKVFCILWMGRYSIENVSEIAVTSTVHFSFKNRLWTYQYSLFYEGENSIEKVKGMTKYFWLLLDQLNSISSEVLEPTEEDILEQAMSYYNEALATSNEGDYEGAIELYSKAIVIYPQSESIKISEAYFNRGVNRRYSGDVSGAIIDYTKALAMRPDYIKALLNRGYAKVLLGDFYGAVEDYNFIIELDPTPTLKSSAYGSRGIAKLNLGLDGCPDLRTALRLGDLSFNKVLLLYCE
jgi:tetratricopeptide (TPR) repeat protein